MTISRKLSLLLLFTFLVPILFAGIAGAESYVVFWSTKKCGSRCSSGETCFWVKAHNGWQHHDLEDMTTSYTERYDVKKYGARGEGGETYKTRTVWKTWEKDIRSVYISDSRTEVIFYEEPDYEGASLRAWGKGCINLGPDGWWDRAMSIKVY